MLSNVEPGESSDELYSPENEEDETDLMCNQQRERKGQNWRKQKRDKTKATTDLQGVKLTTGNNNHQRNVLHNMSEK